MLITVMLIASAAIAYFFGSINGSIIVSNLMFRSDVRERGSGNAGLTNFYRNFGVKGMAGVVGIDVAKGVLGALVGGWLLALAAPETPETMAAYFSDTGHMFAAVFVVLGHVFPIFYDFRGGKGILCGVSAAFIVDWRAGMICLLIFGITFLLTRYVSLGSVLGALSFPVAMLGLGHTGLPVTLSLLAVAMIVAKHGGNIVRLIRRKEPKFELKRDITHKLDEDKF